MPAPVRATPVVRDLTRAPEKAERYGVDPYFRDAWEVLRKDLGSAAAVRRFAWRHVPLLVRPDGIAAGRGHVLLDRLARLGLEVCGRHEVSFDRHLVRELWRYQLNIATRERITMMDRLLIGRPGLVLLLRKDGPLIEPASVSLRAVKGPSAPAQRRSDQLRAALSDARASVITLVHTPDEPIDVLRDLGILFDERELRALLEDRAPVPDDTVLAALRKLQEITGAHSLQLEEAVGRVGRTEDPRTLRDVVGTGDDLGWDHLVIAAHQAATHFPGGRPVVPDTDVGSWRQEMAMTDRVENGEGTLVP